MLKAMLNNSSYLNQGFKLVCALAPLITLGYIYYSPLESLVIYLSFTLILLAIGSAFFKDKICPQYVCDIISDAIDSYLLICLPAIIMILHGYDKDWMMLYLGLGAIILSVLAGILNELKKRKVSMDIAEVHEIKAEAEDNTQLVESLFQDKWKVVNKLCNLYYEKSDSTGSLKLIVRDIEDELQVLRTPESIADILATTDRCLNGAITQLRQECPFLREQDIEFIGLIFSGLSVRAVCYITGLRKANYYQRKNRLMKRIADSDAPAKAQFIDRLANFTK